MQKTKNDPKFIDFTLLTPNTEPVGAQCDSLHLPLKDDLNGQGGGDYNIRRGHAPAILAIGEGSIRVFLDGTPVLEINCSGGFAKVRPNRVTVIAEHISE